jgi:hypothetical protein
LAPGRRQYAQNKTYFFVQYSEIDNYRFLVYINYRKYEKGIEIMTVKNAAKVRERFLSLWVEFLREQGEDVGVDGSGSCNIPVVEDGEEGWVQFVVKVPKWTDDDDGYAKRSEYEIHVAETAEKAKAKEAEKAKKAAKAAAKKAEKAKAKE